MLPLKKKMRLAVGDLSTAWKRFFPGQSNGFRVLVYHSITDTTQTGDMEETTTPRDLFSEHMGYLRSRNYHIVSLEQAADCLVQGRPIPDRAVAVTFDDGFQDNYANAFPVLAEKRIPATIFVTADYLRDVSNNATYLSLAELQEMTASGLIHIGCHTMTHRILTGLSKKGLHYEIEEAKNRLQDLTGQSVSLFAYPFGHSKSYNKEIIEKVRKAGFTAACIGISGLNDHRTDRFEIRRNRISWLDSLCEFEKHMKGATDWSAKFEFLRQKRTA